MVGVFQSLHSMTYFDFFLAELAEACEQLEASDDEGEAFYHFNSCLKRNQEWFFITDSNEQHGDPNIYKSRPVGITMNGEKFLKS